jgi:hypothetical protein
VIIPFSSLSPKHISITQKKFANTRLKNNREESNLSFPVGVLDDDISSPVPISTSSLAEGVCRGPWLQKKEDRMLS